MTKFRRELDTFGPIDVAERSAVGRANRNARWKISRSAPRLMPREIIHALAQGKKAAAKVNAEMGRLDSKLAAAIAEAADEIASGRLDDHFPLKVWQTGLGHAVPHECQRGDRQSRQ